MYIFFVLDFFLNSKNVKFKSFIRRMYINWRDFFRFGFFSYFFSHALFFVEVKQYIVLLYQNFLFLNWAVSFLFFVSLNYTTIFSGIIFFIKRTSFFTSTKNAFSWDTKNKRLDNCVLFHTRDDDWCEDDDDDDVVWPDCTHLFLDLTFIFFSF